MALTIETDRKWKQFRYRSDVPAKVLANQFEHLDEDAGFDGFFCYRKCWYHLSDFMRVADHDGFEGWHGYSNDSYFSGVVMEMSSDGEEYRVGTFYS